jgi:hypothetical protein
MLLNTSSKNLFRAAAITQEIENLEAQLQSLLHEIGAAAIAVDKEVPPPAPKTRDKVSKAPAGKTIKPKKRIATSVVQIVGDPPPKQKAPAPVSELEEVTARRQRNPGKVAMPPAAKSAEPKQGGLAQAIREVLAASEKPLNVSGVYDALIAGGYIFSFPEPKKGLSMRMYRIKGVKPLGEGLFAAAKD